METGPVWLFTPATRPDRVRRAAELADVVVVDCEDAVAEQDKEHARRSLRSLSGVLDPLTTVVRVNAASTDHRAADLDAVRAAGLEMIMVPKAEDPAELAELSSFRVVALCETAAGILAAPALARVPQVVGLMWGSADLASDLGAVPDGPGLPSNGGTDAGDLEPVLEHARWQVLLAARAAGVTAVDHVVIAIDDEERVAADARRAVSGGFDAKAAIHPRQVPTIRRAFHPSEDQLRWARRVVALGDGAHRLDGKLVDEAVRKQAARVLALAQAAGRVPSARNAATVASS